MDRSRIGFVTTANAVIGTGHLRRCLTLAEEFNRQGAACQFWVYAGEPALEAWIVPHATTVEIRPGLGLREAFREAARESSLLVVDSYDVRSTETQPLLDRNLPVLVVDDLANRSIAAQWLLNTCITHASVYADLTRARLLLGPQFALLRTQFRDLPIRAIAETATRVLLTFGGSDVLQLSNRILQILENIPDVLDIRLIGGALAQDTSAPESKHHLEQLRDVDNMAEQMMWADLAITAAGQTTFELAASGCPAICLQVVENQLHTRELFARIGSAVVRDARTASDAELNRLIAQLLDDPHRRGQMADLGKRAVDGYGAKRVVEAILQS